MPDMTVEADGLEEQSSRSRPRDPEQTRRDILDAARIEFADKGFSGARVDDIGARTRTSKRMIYYYFGSKEGLYTAVLEEMYGGIRDAEQNLRLGDLSAQAAMRRLVEATFDHHAAHPEFVRLVAVENIHEGRHVAASPTVRQRNSAVLGTIREVLERGEREGVFRPGVDPFDLHVLISSFCFHRVSNRHTLGAIFDCDLQAPERSAAQRRMIVEAVLRYLEPQQGD